MDSNAMPKRHADRLSAAVATMKPRQPPLQVIEHIALDGRRAYPEIVQYRLKRFNRVTGAYVESTDPDDLLDLPPTETSHPDPQALAEGRQPSSLPYVVVVHQPAAYDRLRAGGWLDAGHRSAPGSTIDVTDNRSAPGA